MLMIDTKSYRGTVEYLLNRWPQYLLGHVALSGLAGIIIWQSVERGWYGFVLLGLTSVIVLIYFGFASLWAAHHLYDNDRIAGLLVEMGKIDPEDRIVQISPGLQASAFSISQRLTTGQVEVVDVYNPQLMPNRALARRHYNPRRQQKDRRLAWRDGTINLLPMTDDSIRTAIVVETVSALWQEGDRALLLNEIQRILQPGGQLLLAERCRTLSNMLTVGPSAIRLRPASYWESLLERCDLQVAKSANIGDLMHFLKGIKPQVQGQRQLPLDL